MATRTAIPDAVAERAVAWLLAVQAAPDDAATREQLARWRAEHPDHDAAWHQIESVNARLAGLAGLAIPAGKLLRAPARPDRRRALKTLALAAGVVGLGGYAAERAGLDADYRTARGEIRHLRLADGSHIVLNSGTWLDIHYDETQRRLRLRRGDLLIETGAADRRPFVVTTRFGSLVPQGTRFLVRDTGPTIALDVYAGAVDIHTSSGQTRRVAAGHGARFDAERVHRETRANDIDAAWSDGVIVAIDRPLGDFLDELARHRPGILVCDPTVAALPVSGTYPIADTDRALDALTLSLPIDIQRVTRWWTRIVPRSA